jgi:hypothetical protein
MGASPTVTKKVVGVFVRFRRFSYLWDCDYAMKHCIILRPSFPCLWIVKKNFIGNAMESIHSVVNGLVFEIDGFIEAYKAKYSNFIIILTGGDADFG